MNIFFHGCKSRIKLNKKQYYASNKRHDHEKFMVVHWLNVLTVCWAFFTAEWTSLLAGKSQVHLLTLRMAAFHYAVQVSGPWSFACWLCVFAYWDIFMMLPVVFEQPMDGVCCTSSTLSLCSCWPSCSDFKVKSLGCIPAFIWLHTRNASCEQFHLLMDASYAS